jgi:hypothetical protein
MSHSDAIRAAIQNLLDSEGDGYVVGNIVVCMSLERVTADGVANIPWMWTPESQPHWLTNALLHEAIDLEDARYDVDSD